MVVSGMTVVGRCFVTRVVGVPSLSRCVAGLTDSAIVDQMVVQTTWPTMRNACSAARSGDSSSRG